ncbi:cupin domain-containing protein [Lacrimispora sp.]|uniref:cupin domain-containing protein n=1 Tax=Lacrimispora sp. TaxID=2719234 RepID=UPI0034603043
MKKTEKNQKWVFNKDIDGEQAAEGVVRKILAYCDSMMCVENHFEKGAVGNMHSHPHTQITYVASGAFEFTIGDETKTVKAGDTLLKQDGVVHGCVCLEKGILVDFFTPMREDFV